MIGFWTVFQLLVDEARQAELLPLFKLALALYLLQFLLNLF